MIEWNLVRAGFNFFALKTLRSHEKHSFDSLPDSSATNPIPCNEMSPAFDLRLWSFNKIKGIFKSILIRKLKRISLISNFF